MKKIIFIILCFTITVLAQFNRGALQIGGTISYECNYWKNEAGRSTFDFNPQCGYFILNNIPLQLTILTVLNTYPKNWDADPDCDLGFGFGAKYYYCNFYFGSSFVYQRWNSIPNRNYLLMESGYLLKLNPKVFIDLGLDYTCGISDANRRISKIKFEIGVAAFL